MIKYLPVKTKNLVVHYQNLKIANLSVPCPYFENVDHKRDTIVNVGKGLPEEIEFAAEKLIKGKKIHNSAEIHAILVKNEIGIDCSGLAVRIEDSLLRELIGISLKDNLTPLKKSFIEKIRFLLRPFTNISANMLTSNENTYEISSYNNIKPGDMIRAGKNHVGVITSVSSKNNYVYEIEYIHSMSDFDLRVGVRKGTIKIIESKGKLADQKWTEKGYKSTMLTEYLSASSSGRGIRRLKALG